MNTPYKGKNQYRTFLNAGKIVSAKIAELEGVVGILGTGSIGRRYGDRHSDLDMLVYTYNESVRKIRGLISHGWIRWKSVAYDLVVVSYERALRAKVPSKFWTQLARWDHQNSQVLYDSGHRIESLLTEKLIYPDSEQKALLKKYQGEVHEFLVYYPEMWAERGDLYNIIDSLFRAVEKITLWIYAKNRVFEPYVSKWLFYHFENRSIPEHRYLSELTEIYLSTRRSIKSVMRLRKKLVELCSRIGLKFELMGIDETRNLETENWEKLPENIKKILSW